MNQLNSVLLEGVIVNEPRAIGGKGDTPVAIFTLQNGRDSLGADNRIVNRSFRIDVRVSGELAENALSTLKKGDLCRVVGRLFRPNSDTVAIQALHIECVGENTEESVMLAGGIVPFTAV